MRILYITNSPIEYSSSANIRNLAIIRGFLELGHDVEILTNQPDYSSKYYDESLLQNLDVVLHYLEGDNHNREREIGVSNKRQRISIKAKLRMIAYKIHSTFSIYEPRIHKLRLLNGHVVLKRQFDIVVSSSDPKSSHRLAELYLKSSSTRCKWIQYWGDPMSNDINRTSIIPRPILIREERRLLSKSDSIIYVSPITHEQQMVLFSDIKNRMFFYPIPITKIDSKLDNSTSSTRLFPIGYYGDYYKRDRNILPLVEACRRLSVTLEIFGNSDMSLKGDKYLSVNSRVSANRIQELENRVGILVCVCNKRGGQIPGKIYHYAATNKPILLVLDGENQMAIRRFFGKYPNYFMCSNNSIDIANMIVRITESKIDLHPIEDFESLKIASSILDTLF